MPSTTRMESVALTIFAMVLDVVADSGGGFGGLCVDDFVLWLECLLDFGHIEGLPVRRGEHVDFAAEGLGEAGPALAEFAGQVRTRTRSPGRSEIGDRRLGHGAGAGAGERRRTSLLGARRRP